MADKYLYNNGGTPTEREALVVSVGAGSAGRVPGLDGAGRLDTSTMPTGIGADTQAIQASEALAAGDLVNIHDVAGAFRVRKADAAAAGKQADGFVTAVVASAATATVYFEGTITGLTGLTPGVRFLSSTTPGASQAASPTGAAQVSQRVGVATSATTLNFEPQTPIQLA